MRTAPTVSLIASPGVIQQGQASVLTWQTANAREVTIAGLDMLPPSGSRSVMPGTSTTYRLVAKGLGGTNEASARVQWTPQAPTKRLHLATRTCSVRTSTMCTSTMNSPCMFGLFYKPAIRPHHRQTGNNCCKQAWLLKNSFHGISAAKFVCKLLNLGLRRR